MCGGGSPPSVRSMNLLTKLFIVFAITCGASWLLKQVVIAASGGADAENAGIAVLWALGMLTFLLTAATGAALALGRYATWVRIVGGLLAVPVAFVALEVLDSVVEAVYTADGWFAQEIPLVVAALVAGALGLRTLGGVRHA